MTQGFENFFLSEKSRARSSRWLAETHLRIFFVSRVTPRLRPTHIRLKGAARAWPL